jgi:hypothetical protein
MAPYSVVNVVGEPKRLRSGRASTRLRVILTAVKILARHKYVTARYTARQRARSVILRRKWRDVLTPNPAVPPRRPFRLKERVDMRASTTRLAALPLRPGSARRTA